MSRLVSLCDPIGVKHGDFADIGFIEEIDIGDIEGFLGPEGRVDLRFIFGLISQTDEAIFPSAKEDRLRPIGLAAHRHESLRLVDNAAVDHQQ